MALREFPEAWKQGMIDAKLPRKPSKLQQALTNCFEGKATVEETVDVVMEQAKRQELYVGKKSEP